MRKIVVVENPLCYQYGKRGILLQRRFDAGDRRMVHRLQVHLFIRQLHIAVVVLVIQVRTTVMHGQELKETYAFVQLMVFHIVAYQGRQLQELVQGGIVQQ